MTTQSDPNVQSIYCIIFGYTGITTLGRIAFDLLEAEPGRVKYSTCNVCFFGGFSVEILSIYYAKISKILYNEQNSKILVKTFKFT